jgi:hypothetical protein
VAGQSSEWTVQGARHTLRVRAPAATVVSAAEWERRPGVWRLLLCGTSAAQRWEFTLELHKAAAT